MRDLALHANLTRAKKFFLPQNTECTLRGDNKLATSCTLTASVFCAIEHWIFAMNNTEHGLNHEAANQAQAQAQAQAQVQAQAQTAQAVATPESQDQTPAPGFINLDCFLGASLDDLYQHACRLHAKSYLDSAELNKVASALAEVQTILSERNLDQYTVRQARLSDIDSLQNMVNYWAQQGENLPRSREDLIRNIQSFAVCVKDNTVLGCACLYVYDTGLAEVRSLGVNPMVQRQGQGRALVEFLLHKAVQFEIKKVFALTRNPKFFAKVGFTETTINALPEKILKDCEHCPKRERCDEVAYEFNLDFANGNVNKGANIAFLPR